MEWSPVLREEILRLELPPLEAGGEAGAAGPGGEALADPVLGHRINLGPVSRALLDRIDGRRTLSAILDETCAALPERSRDSVEHTFRTLLLMNVIDGAGRDIVERVIRVRRGEERLQPVTLPEARFECQGSGACCRNYALGPLTMEDVARLSKQEDALREAYPEIGPGPYTEKKELRDGTSGQFLRTRGGSCVFQRPDGLCGVHAVFGYAEKPRMCRVFPLQDVPTVFGLRIYDRGECTRFGKSARAGTRWADDMPRILALLGEPKTLYHPLVLLDSSTPCDYGHFLRLQDALCELVRRGGSGLDALLRAERALRGFGEALRGCPLEPGEPDRTVAAFLTEVLAAEAPAPTPADDAAALEALPLVASLASDLLSAVLPTILYGDRGPEEHLAVRDLEHFAGVVHTIEALAVYKAGRQGGERIDAFHERVLSVRAGGPDLDEAHRVSLMHQLFGMRLLIHDRPTAGMLRTGMVYLIAELGARRLAVRDDAQAVREEDFSASHSLAQRVLHRDGVRDVFLTHAARCREIFAALPALCGAAS